ncbi:uncharacterized protein LOC128724633 [Anopheles nili]|uniref:uncharacterized protein LOC128724633 n=1 Tax=Anopheles nili TaxID=185578 RepID=UPI00237B3B81|nr:uncharacterized protein LOC128724633 [Anopheles nili]
MDLEERQLATLEEQLYSSIHHGSYEDPSLVPSTASIPVPFPRVVSRTFVVNNGQTNLALNKKRYWTTSTSVSKDQLQPPSIPKPYHNNKPTMDTKQPTDLVAAQRTSNEPKMFLAPYQSLLNHTSNPCINETDSSHVETVTDNANTSEQQVIQKFSRKTSGLDLKKKKQSSHPVQAVNKKLSSLMKLVNKDRKENAMQIMGSKKAKANQVRARKRQQHIVAQITLDSSDDECRSRTVHQASTDVPLSSDGETDEVEIIPAPPPLQICIDCSDEEAARDSFALPKANKKRKNKKLPTSVSPRCLSPSNSSILSDDFIGQHDRCRLNESFTESIPNDDELECSMKGIHHSVSGKPNKETCPMRRERAPSISSEDTICTSGSTDQEKRTHECGKEISSLTRPALVGEADAIGITKSKKNDNASKKTPAKAKVAKASQEAVSTPVTGVGSESIAKRLSGKSKTRCKSPVSLALELTCKQFQSKNSRTGSAKKKTKAKNSDTVTSSSTLSEHCINLLVTDSKARSPKRHHLSFVEDNVSSESDYDISLLPGKAASSTNLTEHSSKQLTTSLLDEMVDISSESDYNECFNKKSKPNEKQPSAKNPKKRADLKRKKYNSETFSDEDFACLLTDIVRAVSDSEDDDDDMELGEQQPDMGLSVTNEATLALQQKPVRKKTKKTKKVPLEVDSMMADSEAATHKKATRSEKRQSVTPVESVKKKKKLKDGRLGAATSLPSSADSVKDKEQNECQSLPQAQQKKQNSTQERTTSICEVISESDDDIVQIIDANHLNTSIDSSNHHKKTQATDHAFAWNEEMTLFYNEPWMEGNFTLDSVLESMPRDPNLWFIVQKDRYPDPPRKESTCTNCGDRGHIKYRCRNRPKPSICYMCGDVGHLEPRCPKTICLMCGAKTRHFVRGCKACSREVDITCYTCGVRGHSQRNCPDLWRRYHSTTEDNVPLNEKFEINHAVKGCCICSKLGHEAHKCNAALRIFGHAIPNMNVKSYMPSYRGEYNRYQKHQLDEQQKRIASDPTTRYNLFSYNAKNSELNLEELLQNEDGFYYRFCKATGLLEKRVQLQQSEMDDRIQLEEQLTEAELSFENKVDPEPVDINAAEERSLPVGQPLEQTSNNVQQSNDENLIKQPCNVSVVEENSNYSFSEFLTEETDVDGVHSGGNEKNETELSAPVAEDECAPVADKELAPVAEDIAQDTHVAASFIPLDNNTNAPQGVIVSKPDDPAISKVCDARIFLTKAHAQVLLSPKGAEYMNEACKKFAVKVHITFESIGNIVLVSGIPEDQNRFHTDLISYLTGTDKSATDKKEIKMNLNHMPRLCYKMEHFIRNHMKPLSSNLDVHLLLKQYEETSNDLSDKIRKTRRRKLNIALFGQYGMREGRKHMNFLRAQLKWCSQADSMTVLSASHRNEIAEAIQYIFSSMDHSDYTQIVKEYEELSKSKKLQAFTWKGFEMPAHLLGKKTNTFGGTRRFDKQGNNFSSSNNANCPPNGLILNTCDQLIDPVRLSLLDGMTQFGQASVYNPFPYETEHHPHHHQRNGNFPSYETEQRYTNYDQGVWRNNRTPKRNQYRWYRNSNSNENKTDSVDLSRLADRAHNLRLKEMDFLEGLERFLQ